MEKEKCGRTTMLVDVNDTLTHGICYERCENNKSVVLEAQNLSSIGRFLTVNTTIKMFALISKLL